LGAFAHAQNPPGFKELAIGDPAPAFKLPDTEGKERTLADFASAKVLAVAFTSNHCPTSNAAFPRLIALSKELAAQGFGVVAINPNHPEALRPDELGYSKYGDSYEEMKLHARDAGFPFPYLYDGETQTTAMAYGCLATPHVFLFDAERKLRYKGWIDDSRFPGADTVTRPDLANAVRALLAGKPVPVTTTRPIGCSTKWRLKREQVRADDEKWANLPVTLEDIDADGVRKLRTNAGGRHRLIHVWSTTCAPCVAEFPGVARVARRMGLRDFELVTISTDAPEDREKAADFLRKIGAGLPPHLRKSLEKEGRKTNSYLFSGASLAPLVEALDPAWEGPLPHTILLKPDGQVGFRHTGPLTEEQLLGKILAVMTPYYQP
jgi:thiol-disulfide isomerase/thioredoxin